MSYILDALKRAERERKQGQVSVLDEIPSAPALESQRRRPRWLVPGVAGVLALVLLAGGVLAWRHRGPGTAAPVPVAVVAAAAAPPAPPPVEQTNPQPAASEPPPGAAATIEDGSKIATMDDVAEQPEAQDQAPADEQEPEAADADVNGGNPPAPAQTPPAARPLPRQPNPAPQEAPPPPAEAADAATEGTPAQPQVPPASAQRSLKEMPETFRANFPTFTVDVHAYNADRRRRFVLINGKRYREGDTLAEGPRVVGIVPEGIVFDWQGQQVLYAMGH